MEIGPVLLPYKNQPKKTQLIFYSDVSIKLTEAKVHRRHLPKNHGTNLCNRCADSITNLYMLLVLYFQNKKETLYSSSCGAAHLIFFLKKDKR
jgi:hypothetical protein